MATQVVVVWFERAIDGTAAGAHLRGTLARLNAIEELTISRIVSDTQSSDGRERYLRKAARLTLLTLKAVVAARRRRLLFARYHPLMLPVVCLWRLVGGRVVLSVQGAPDTAINEHPWVRRIGLFRFTSRATSKLAHGIVVGAPTIEDLVRAEMLGRNSSLISVPNGVFIEDYDAAAATPRPQVDRYAVFIGNLATWQGVDTMVAAARLPTWPHGVELVVIGDGVERSKVQDAENVTWLGRLASPEARRWLVHAEFALSLQKSDAAVAVHGFWPFKVIESAAAGVPVICSDAHGLAEAAERLGNAILIRSNDPPAAASAASKLADSPQLRAELGARGRESAAAYAWSAAAPRLAEFFQQLSK